MRFGIVPLSFKSPRYLIIYEDKITTADELSAEVVDELGLDLLRVVDLDTYQEILPDLTVEELEED